MARRALQIAGLLVVVLGIALAAGAALLPGIVRSQAQAWVAANLPGKQLSLGPIAFDPWQLALTLDRVAIADRSAPAAPLLAARRLTIDVARASLWTLSPRLDALIIEAPVAEAVLRRDGGLNLAELLPRDDGSPTPTVVIADLRITGGVVHFTDARAAAPQRLTAAPIAFSLRDFTTTSTTGGDYRLTAATDDGARLAWHGRVAMAPLASAGRFAAAGLRLTTLGRFAGAALPVQFSAGRADLAGSYRLAPARAGADASPISARLDRVAVAGMALATPGGDRVTIDQLRLAPTEVTPGTDAIDLGALRLTGVRLARRGGERAAVTALDLAPSALRGETATIGAARIAGISVTGRGRGAATVALAGLDIAESTVSGGDRHAAIGAVAARGLRLGARLTREGDFSLPGLYPLASDGGPAAGASAGWQVALAGLTLADGAAQVEVARGSAAPVRIDLARLALRIGPLTSALAAPVALDLAGTVNGKARLHLGGSADPRGSADLAVDLAGLPLADALALAPPRAVLVQSGVLGLKGRLQIAAAGSRRDARFAGDVEVGGFAAVRRSSGEPLASWQRLRLAGLRAQSAAPRLDIARVEFDRLESHITVTREQLLNLSVVADEENGDAAPPPPAPLGKLKVSAPVNNSAAALGRLLPVSIGVVAIRDSIIDFADLSIEPNFTVRVENFHGRISDLSTAPGSQAKFDLTGFVGDRFAPATLTGAANVFAYDANTDLTASFRNIELPLLNPYSGRFAGYNIAKGKLTTTLHYRIANRALKADHKVEIARLAWGPATDSKAKVSLPVRLAASLLKDRDGVIRLDVPVEGTLDDPSFRIWPFVWKIVGNVLGNLVTAPFRLIGGLFGGGGEKAQFIAFAPGSAVLGDDAGKALAALAKGLAERPEVGLDIPAGSGIAADAEALTTRKLHAAVLAGKGGGDDYAGLEPGRKLDKLKSLYKAKFGKAADLGKADGVTTAGLLAGGAAKDAAAASQIDWLERQLRPKLAPAADELAALGAARADAVKQALLGDGAIAPERVFIATDAAVTAKDGRIEMELKVK